MNQSIFASLSKDLEIQILLRSASAEISDLTSISNVIVTSLKHNGLDAVNLAMTERKLEFLEHSDKKLVTLKLTFNSQ